MLKVLIADDEKNICQMIRKLITWENYGMEVVGLAYNGVEAIEIMEEKRPDLVISDIRMPGRDGLEIVKYAESRAWETEFIIISGYKYFEYAHTALNLGVEHYLLKPIDQKELEQVLAGIAEKHMQQVKKSEEEVKLRNMMEGRREMRRHFLGGIVNHRELELLEDGAAETLLAFEKDAFAAFFTKIDTETWGEDLSPIVSMLEKIIELPLKEGEHEYINYPVRSGVVTLVNYHSGSQESIEQGTERSLSKMRYELDKFRGYHVTVGVGSYKASINGVGASVDEAVKAVKCRSLSGQDKVIYYQRLRYQPVALDAYLSEKRLFELKNMVEALDGDALGGEIARSVHGIQEKPRFSPVAVYEYLEKVIDVVLQKLRENFSEEPLVLEMDEELQKCIDFYVDLGTLAYRIAELLAKYFDQLIKGQRMRGQLPVRLAKQYIQANYKRQISQEEVAREVGLSSAYLSTCFKKELGINFSDYLTSCRMDAAKELLKASDVPVTEVAGMVGYADARHFSKTFLKIVGIKPSVYRKLYR